MSNIRTLGYLAEKYIQAETAWTVERSAGFHHKETYPPLKSGPTKALTDSSCVLRLVSSSTPMVDKSIWRPSAILAYFLRLPRGEDWC